MLAGPFKQTGAGGGGVSKLPSLIIKDNITKAVAVFTTLH
jgi:hypothetical protein